MTARAADRLLGLGLLFELLDLRALPANLALLRSELRSGLPFNNLVILEFVAYYGPGYRPKSTADRCAGTRMTDCRADYRAGTGSQHATSESPLFTGRQGLPRTGA
jgi:hypothetical protein